MRMQKNRDKFVELAEKRMRRTLKDIRLVGNLSNRSNYKYTNEDIKKIYKALRIAIDEMKSRFERKGDDEEIDFRL